MTGGEWRRAREPDLLLYDITHRGCGSLPKGGPFGGFSRPLWLFCAACFRVRWEELADDRLRQAVAILEAFGAADRWPDRDQLVQTFVDADDAARALPPGGPATALGRVLAEAAESLGPEDEEHAYRAAEVIMRDEVVLPFPAQCDLLREIFGATPEPVRFDREWLSWQGGVVRRIAAGVWEEWAFDRLPVLADALEEAGCREEAVLRHCRGTGRHVPGCWVVDLLLERPR